MTNNSIPPDGKTEVAKIAIIAHHLIDGIAIISTVVLILFDKLDASVGVPIIALIAGVWLNNAKNKDMPGGPSLILAATTGFVRLWGVNI